MSNYITGFILTLLLVVWLAVFTEDIVKAIDRNTEAIKSTAIMVEK